jgi:hypothetical protein
MNIENRDFYLTNSALYSQIIKCNSRIDDLDVKARVDVAKALVKDSKLYDGKVLKIAGRDSDILIEVLEMQSTVNLESIKENVANIIIKNNNEKLNDLMMKQLMKYVAKASGVNENIFYGG